MYFSLQILILSNINIKNKQKAPIKLHESVPNHVSGAVFLYLPVLHRPDLSVLLFVGERSAQCAENLDEHDHQQHNYKLQSLHRHQKKSGCRWSRKTGAIWTHTGAKKLPPKTRILLLHFARRSCVKVSVCSYKVPLLAPPHSSNLILKWIYPAGFFHCLTQTWCA